MRALGYLRLMLPAFLLAAGSIGVLAWANTVTTSPVLAGVRLPAGYLALGLMIAAVLYCLWVGWRIIRAEQGRELLCDCGGLLGRERVGRYGPYRRCLQCSRNHSCKDHA